jgi:hypothetical protein
MEFGLDFSAFRRRLERAGPLDHGVADLETFNLDALRKVCKWVFAGDRPGYCFGSKDEDTVQLRSFFAENPGVDSFECFPSRLYKDAFCALHEKAAATNSMQHSLKSDADSRGDKYFDGGIDADRKIAHETSNALQPIQYPILDEPAQYLTDSNDSDESMHFRLDEDDQKYIKWEPVFDDKAREVRLALPDRIVRQGDGPAVHDGTSTVFSTQMDSRRPELKSSPCSARAEAAEQRQRDMSHMMSVTHNNAEVMKKLMEPSTYSGKAPGYVYAFLDPELGLIKIGSTRQSISKRLGRIQTACKPGAGLEIIAGNETVPIVDPYRLERLIQLDLQPHRWFFNCPCKKDGGHTRHREYFQVTRDVAVRTVTLWNEFMLQNPYGHYPGPGVYSLQSPWSERMSAHRLDAVNETVDDHEKRLARWKRLLLNDQEGITGAISSSDDRSNPARRTVPDKYATGDGVGSGADVSLRTPSISTASVQEPAPGDNKPIHERSGASAWQSLLSPQFSFRCESASASPNTSMPHLRMSTSHHSISSKPSSFSSPPNVVSAASVSMGKAVDAVSTPTPNKFAPQIASKTAKSNAGKRNIAILSSAARAASAPSYNKSYSVPDFGRRRPASFGGHHATNKASLEDRALLGNSETKAEDMTEPFGHSQQSKGPANVQDPSNEVRSAKDTGPPLSTGEVFSVDLHTRLRGLRVLLDLERKGLDPRTIRMDLIQFRWPLACGLALSLCASRLPPGLAFVLWFTFLSAFMAELRSWFPITVVQG